MRSIGFRKLGRIGLPTLLAVLTLTFAGCARESADQSLDRALKESNRTREATAQFGGKVTIDGQKPNLERGQVLLVMLYDPQKPPENRQIVPRAARCRGDGSFAFNTYGTDDGAPVGNYIVLFAVLKAAAHGGYRGPDTLKNLYNDPDKNSKVSEYRLDLKPPGKMDWTFDLAVAGKEPVTPGPHAATGIVKGG